MCKFVIFVLGFVMMLIRWCRLVRSFSLMIHFLVLMMREMLVLVIFLIMLWQVL